MKRVYSLRREIGKGAIMKVNRELKGNIYTVTHELTQEELDIIEEIKNHPWKMLEFRGRLSLEEVLRENNCYALVEIGILVELEDAWHTTFKLRKDI